MYSIRADGVTIADDQFIDEMYTVIDPVLHLDENEAGKLEITMPPACVGYSIVQRMNTTLSVWRGDFDCIWMGRVISEDRDFNNHKSLVAEGALAWLNDTMQPFKLYSKITVQQYLQKLLDIHNSKVGANRKILLGEVTVVPENVNNTRWVTNWDTTLSYIKELNQAYHGHIHMRYTGSEVYMDYLKDYPKTSEQRVAYGSNLLDCTFSNDLTDMVTVCVPLGKTKSKSSIEGESEHITCASANNGSPYVMRQEAVSSFGWIEKVVNFNEIEKPADLLKEAKTWLSNNAVNDETSIEATAIDLNRFGIADVPALDLLDNVRFESEPHGVITTLPITSIEIPLYEIDNAVYTFGESLKQKLTKINNTVNNEIIQRVTGSTVTPDTTYTGSDTIGSNGECVVSVDILFTGMDVVSYQVFLSAYSAMSSSAALYVSSRTEHEFVVKGDPGASFAWEIKGIVVRESGT